MTKARKDLISVDDTLYYHRALIRVACQIP